MESECVPPRGANDTAVAEYVIATTMGLLRGAYRASDAVMRGDWPRQACIGREVAGKAFPVLPNLILTPHIAGVSAESNMRVSAVTAENVRRILGDIS